MNKQLFAGAALVALAIPASVMAQETTTTIQGTVSQAGAPLPGATITITHVPSGTRATAITDTTGNYSVSGLRVGGPFTVAVNDNELQVTDIFTTAGQDFALPLDVPAVATADTIVVTASRVANAGSVSRGPVAILGREQIAQVASINRDIRDLARRDPFATLDTSSTTGRNVSFAGQNPRFNRFTIDGVPITDSFGLNPDALPSRRGPVPLDAIEQFQTKIAPYDIREGFFQGGVVNAVLRSGTNEFHGTGFYTYSSNKLVGNQTKPYITNPTGIITQYPFKDRDFGAQVSGPIIPDKLFFMVAAERVRANRPIDRGTVETNAGAPVPGVTNALVQQIAAIAQSRYSYNSGGVLTGNNDKDDRLVMRLDANLSDTQRASATYIYTKDSLNTQSNTANTGLGLESNAYIKPNKVQAGIVQLNSTWSSTFSTEFRGLYKNYRSGQFPLLANGAQFQVCTAANSDRPTVPSGSTSTTLSGSCPSGTPSLYVGPGGPSQYNVLKVEQYGGQFLGRLTMNDHNVRLIAEASNTSVYNLFVNGGNGTYYFDSIADFQAGNAQSFSYTNAPSNNTTDAAARFRYQTYTFGIQDDWDVADFLNVSYGARYDLFGGNSRPAINPAFVARYGFTNAAYISGRGLFQPRFGFELKPVRGLSVRGGGGIFGGGTPDVYVSNSFANSGVLTNTLTARIVDGLSYQLNGGATSATTGQALLNNVSISTVPTTAQTLLAGGTLSATTSTASLDPNFKIPSQFRATLSVDYNANLGPLGDGWRFGADAFYSRVRNQVLFVDLRSVPVAGSLTPDGRQRYRGLVSATDSGNDIQLTNTKLGRSYVGVVRFSKDFDFGMNVFGSYTRQDVKDQAPATSSIASSNYNNGPYLDPNRVAYGTSNDEVKWSFKYGVGFDRQFIDGYHTRFNLFGETRAGSPYSFGFQDSTASRSTVFGTTGTNTRYLFYVPTGTTDPLVTYAGATPADIAATAARVDAIINANGLNGYRGKVAPRNVFRSKSFTKIDLHAEQEIPFFLKTKITLFGDIENFTNLLDHKWGQQLRANFSYNKTLVNVACANAACTQYLYSQPRSDALIADQLVTANGSSLYAIRVGARFTF